MSTVQTPAEFDPSMSTEPRTITSRGVNACRDTYNILSEVDKIAEASRLALASGLKFDEFGRVIDADDTTVTDPTKRQLFTLKALSDLKEWVENLPNDSKRPMERHVDRLEKLGPYRRVGAAVEPEDFDELLRTYPNFGDVTRTIQRRLALCRVTPDQLIQLPPILLAGPPGVGKTAYCRAVAGLLNVPLRCFDMAAISAPFSISGLDIGYSTGRPGLLWDALQDDCMSPIILLDELDKFQVEKGAGTSFLLGLLEPLSARCFEDAALRLPLDASRVLWIGTCNSLEGIDAPLRSRFRTFHIEAPTDEQMEVVVRSIHGDLMNNEDWAAHFNGHLEDSIVDALASCSPRQIRQALEDAYAHAAAAGRRYITVGDVELTQVRATGQGLRRIGFMQ